jgi:saccharopine dehydrogenase-like NADP-dependent oxidoreductase
MKQVLVLGAGLVAGPLVRYLLDRPDTRLVVADVEVGKAQKLIAGASNGEAKRMDLGNRPELAAEIGRCDLVVSMVPYTFHPIVAALAIDHGKDMVTASYVSPAMKELDVRAREKGVLILNELGLDPGIDHMEAMRIIREVHEGGGRVLTFTSYCGGLPAPEANTNPFGYKFSWSPMGVLLASRNPARYLRDGEVVAVPAERLFAEPETVRIAGLGDFEGYPNRDSVPYRETYGIPEARSILRGTLRYPGWCLTLLKIGQLGLLDDIEKDRSGSNYIDLTAELAGAAAGEDVRAAVARRLGLDLRSEVMDRLEWLGLFESRPLAAGRGSALDNLAALMIEKLQYAEEERDMIVLQHEFLTEGGSGRTEKIVSTLVDYGIPGGASSMSRTVGLPAAIAARLILDGRIARKGVEVPVHPEIYVPILEELREAGIRFTEERRVWTPAPC